MAAGEEATVANNKIIAVGVGQVGKACESSILGKSLADELALVNAWKCICSMGTSFFRHLKLWQRTDHPVTMGITAGVHQRERESHLSKWRLGSEDTWRKKNKNKVMEKDARMQEGKSSLS